MFILKSMKYSTRPVEKIEFNIINGLMSRRNIPDEDISKMFFEDSTLFCQMNLPLFSKEKEKKTKTNYLQNTDREIWY